jgi:hypothetical protein
MSRPYGYEPGGQRIRKNEAKTIRDAAGWILDGEGVRGVAQWLNDHGVTTSTGGRWHPISLRRLLASPRIAGLRREVDGRLVKADWPAIIDRRTHTKLAKLLTEPDRKPTEHNTGAVRSYLLTGGLAVCGRCGTRLVSRPARAGQRSYVCASALPYNGCGKTRCVADPLEEHVVEVTLARLANPRNAAAVRRALDTLRKSGKQADAAVRADERKLAELGRDYADGTIGRVEFHAARDRIAQRIAAERARQKLAERADEISALDSAKLTKWWDGASLEQRHSMLTLLIDRVEVGPVAVQGSKRFDPSRVRIIWR